MQAQRKLISFIGLGVGSIASTLYEYVRAHPEAYIPKTGTNFFSDINIYAEGIDWYESNFSGYKSGQKCGELSDNYLEIVSAISLIARTYPSAKLFAVIENPLIAVRVAYVEAKRSNKISPEVTLDFFLKHHSDILTRYRYGRQLTQYFSYYSHNDLMVVTASDVSEDPLNTIAILYEHVGLDKKFIPITLKYLVPEDEDEPKRRPGIIKRTFKFLFKNIKRVYIFIMHKIKAPKVLPDSVLVEARNLSLSPDTEKFLKDYYRQDVLVLSSLLHRNFDVEWGFRELKLE
jgi:hypothetical protein